MVCASLHAASAATSTSCSSSCSIRRLGRRLCGSYPRSSITHRCHAPNPPLHPSAGAGARTGAPLTAHLGRAGRMCAGRIMAGRYLLASSAASAAGTVSGRRYVSPRAPGQVIPSKATSQRGQPHFVFLNLGDQDPLGILGVFRRQSNFLLAESSSTLRTNFSVRIQYAETPVP
eukprot:COSAG02_NODE_6061_length_3833_cov_6.676486_4_plen_174_part_00